MKASITWPLIIVAFLALSVGANVALIYFASTDPSFAVEENYYEKAIHWDETAALRAASERLGWDVKLTSSPARLQIRLSDRSDEPVEGAWVEVKAFPNIRATQAVTGELRETRAGTYELEGSFLPAGIWEVRLKAERGDEVFVQTLRTEIFAPRGARKDPSTSDRT
ncbi:MAG TPA: FixH family protein [Myxococcales bacterium LLY-WYZ-16_1]|jgi:nitrogen fixation protein FixH|nr:FixH family protein [Myxococcales bacterium LLY-WYZ-16_1]